MKVVEIAKLENVVINKDSLKNAPCVIEVEDNDNIAQIESSYKSKDLSPIFIKCLDYTEKLCSEDLELCVMYEMSNGGMAYISIESGGYYEIVRLLIDKGIEDSLVNSIKSEDLKRIELLIKHLPENDYVSGFKNAVYSHNHKALSLLISSRRESFQELQANNEEINWCITDAVDCDYVDVIKILVKEKADLSFFDDDGNTLLEIAQESDYQEMISLLKHIIKPRDKKDQIQRVFNSWKKTVLQYKKNDWKEYKTLIELTQSADDWDWKMRQEKDYLIHKKKPLSICVDTEFDAKDHFCPGWFNAVNGLNSTKDININGALLNSVALGQMTRSTAADFFPEIEYVKPFPQKFHPLQMNCHGTIIAYNAHHQVLMRNQNNKYEKIGTLECFIRYCVYQILKGNDWFHAYCDNIDLDKYELRHIDAYAD